MHIGGANLRKQIENIKAARRDPRRRHQRLPRRLRLRAPGDPGDRAPSSGVRAAVCTHFADGGRGATELAEAVAEAAEEPSEFHLLYPSEASLKEKIEAIATTIYGADGVDYLPQANRQLDTYEKNGFGNLPVCIAKTHLSMSSDPSLKGAPTGWRLPVREVRASVGAGFIYPICGDMRTMPGLSSHPAAERIDIDENGEIVGLS